MEMLSLLPDHMGIFILEFLLPAEYTYMSHTNDHIRRILAQNTLFLQRQKKHYEKKLVATHKTRKETQRLLFVSRRLYTRSLPHHIPDISYETAWKYLRQYHEYKRHLHREDKKIENLICQKKQIKVLLKELFY